MHRQITCMFLGCQARISQCVLASRLLPPIQVSYSQAEACYVARCPEGLQPEVGTDGGWPVVTARSTQQQQTAGGATTPLPPPAGRAGAGAPPGPTIIAVTEPGPAAGGRRLLGTAAVQQDVFVVMSFAASCFSVCE